MIANLPIPVRITALDGPFTSKLNVERSFRTKPVRSPSTPCPPCPLWLIYPPMHDQAETTSTPPKDSTPGAALSPAMRQYQQFKTQYPDYVLFFRMGDFYEMFWEDAQLAAKVLGVALTSRSRGGIDAADAIPMAGVPFHAVESYLRKMIA